ncbi:hypothetical protein C1Y63_07025 [Corynebacterium sp. 13CS0277]|uniref:HNH endonuclease signature motif containing protein n=1 Tax=Corynebacterium sp. 13CS0277 TaxID=2071994 RepID=UPI000D024419|nr:HNH endonuclease signature motif containing protein [Corynebacterium sp. 13CS0277]PRQ11297.1 hypothetical protein C1Y63_07025 [Corynebacterium sp. 13CS0277]
MDWISLTQAMPSMTSEQRRAAMEQAQPQLRAAQHLLAEYAYYADKDNAGDEVGSPRTEDYLAELYAVPTREAKKLITRGASMYKPVRKDQRAAQEEFRDMHLSGQLSDATVDDINAAVVKANEGKPTPEDPAARLELARLVAGRPIKDAKRMLKERQEPASDRQPAKPGAESLHWSSTTDSDGLYTLTAKCNPTTKGLLDGFIAQGEAVMKGALRHTKKSKKKKDDEGPNPAWLAIEGLKRAITVGSGAPALVVSVTAQELLGTQAEYLGSHGGTLNGHEVQALIDEADWWLCIHDPVTFVPIALGRTERLASVAQRIALHAEQGVCQADGCNQGSARCQVHHLKAWRYGGKTDVDNLALLCARHHGLNRDAGPNRRRGQFQRDADGKVRFKFRGRATEGESTMSRFAAGETLRHLRGP